jgi:hypothetical protein
MAYLEKVAAYLYAEYIAGDLFGAERLCVTRMAFSDWEYLKPAVQKHWLSVAALEAPKKKD